MPRLKSARNTKIKKKCVKSTAYPCGFSCIARYMPDGKERICRNVLRGQADTFSKWLKMTEERLAKVNAYRSSKGKDTLALRNDVELVKVKVKSPERQLIDGIKSGKVEPIPTTELGKLGRAAFKGKQEIDRKLSGMEQRAGDRLRKLSKQSTKNDYAFTDDPATNKALEKALKGNDVAMERFIKRLGETDLDTAVKEVLETSDSFESAIAKAEKGNRESNRKVKESLEGWEKYKADTVAETQAEADGKLSHLSDYRKGRSITQGIEATPGAVIPFGKKTEGDRPVEPSAKNSDQSMELSPTIERNGIKSPKGYRFAELGDLQGLSEGDEVFLLQKKKIRQLPVESISVDKDGYVTGIYFKESAVSRYGLLPSEMATTIIKPINAPIPNKKNDYKFKGFNAHPVATEKRTPANTGETQKRGGRNNSQELNAMLKQFVPGHLPGKRYEVLSDAKKFAQEKGLDFPEWAQSELTKSAQEVAGIKSQAPPVESNLNKGSDTQPPVSSAYPTQKETKTRSFDSNSRMEVERTYLADVTDEQLRLMKNRKRYNGLDESIVGASIFSLKNNNEPVFVKNTYLTTEIIDKEAWGKSPELRLSRWIEVVGKKIYNVDPVLGTEKATTQGTTTSKTPQVPSSSSNAQKQPKKEVQSSDRPVGSKPTGQSNPKSQLEALKAEENRLGKQLDALLNKYTGRRTPAQQSEIDALQSEYRKVNRAVRNFNQGKPI